MRSVVLDANVVVSLLTGRHAQQRDVAAVLLQEAEDGEVALFLPQFIVFETTYVLQSQYDVTGDRLAMMIQDLVLFPGVLVTDDCPWKQIFELWPSPLSSLTDAAIVAVAMTNRYDAIATFDQKLARRAKNLGVATYF